MNLDAIIISGIGEESFSSTNPLRLKINGQVGTIQETKKFLANGGGNQPIHQEDLSSWASAPKLNGLYLYSFLNKENFDVELINNFYSEKETFAQYLKRSPRMIVISTTFIHRKKDLSKLINDIRLLAPDIFIVVGGTFVLSSYLILEKSFNNDYLIEPAKRDYLFLGTEDEPLADLYIVSQRGERTLSLVLKAKSDGTAIPELPNTIKFDGIRYSFFPRNDALEEVSLGPLDWEKVPEKFFRAGVLPIQGSIGCRHNCSFCNFVKDRRLLRSKSIDELVNELQLVQGLGIKYVWFTDDDFRLGSRDLDQFCAKLIEKEVGIKWLSFIRASTLMGADFELLSQAGCVEVQLGLESADTSILKNMHKNATPELYYQITRELMNAGINCSAYFIFGFPGETEGTAQRTRDFIRSIEFPQSQGILNWSIFPFILAPLSPVYENKSRRKYGLTGYMNNWSHLTMNSDLAYEQVLKTFLALENSGAIYRDDDLEMLFRLDPMKRKAFIRSRHQLAKISYRRNLDFSDFEVFRNILT